MPMIKLVKNIDFNGFTLIIPSVSVGNVPQLTIDLLITNFNLTKSGIIWHPAIIPTIGADPFDPNSSTPCTACEIYACESMKLAVIQLRSGLESRLVNKFTEDLNKDVITHFGFSRIVILSSAFDYELHNIEKGKYYYVDSKKETSLEKLNFRPLEMVDGEYIVHGGGYGMSIYKTVQKIHCTVLVKYVSEGDNIPDAVSMINILCNYLNLSEGNVKSLKFPYSWSHLFGGPPPVGMF